MKPCSRKALYSSKFLQSVSMGSVISDIHGTVRKLNVNYNQAIIVLYDKSNLQPLAVARPKANGQYSFNGLNRDWKTFIVGFDLAKQFNAVIQDNVVME